MIKERLARVIKALTGACEHKPEERAISEQDFCLDCSIDLTDETTNVLCGGKEGKGHNLNTRERLVCLSCGNELAPPTKHFRSYIRLKKHIRFRTGIPTNRNGERLSEQPTYNVGLRYVVPGFPNAVKRVWVTFDDKKSQQNFGTQMQRRMLFCKDDEGYNTVIKEAIDIIREANPDVTEQVVENDDSETDKA
jgi:hypothetical protein